MPISASDNRTITGHSTAIVIARQGTSVFVTQLAILIAGLLNNFFVSYLAGPTGKGVIYLIQFVGCGLGLTVTNFGLGPAAVYYLCRIRRHSLSEVAGGTLWASLLLGSVPAIAYALLWPWIHHLRMELSPRFLLLALIAIPAFVVVFNLNYIFLALDQMWNYNLLRLAQPAIFVCLLVAIFFAHRGAAVWTLAIAWLISAFAPALGAMFVTGIGMDPAGAGWHSFLPDAFRFGWRSHLGAVTQYMQHRVDVLLVAALLPLKELGIYSIAVGLAEILWYTPQTIATVLMPYISKSSDNDANRITPIFCRASLAITSILALLLGLASWWFIPRILPAFTPAIKTLWLLFPGVIVASVFKVISSDFTGRGVPLRTFYPAVTALAAATVAGLFLIPRFGITGAALVTSGGYILNSVLYIRSYSKLTSVPVHSLLIVRPRDFHRMSLVYKSYVQS